MLSINEWLGQTSSREKLIVIGAGSLGKLTIDCVLKNKDYLVNDVALLDDNEEVQGKNILGIPVIGTIEQAKVLNVKGNIIFVIAIANNKIRKKIVEENPVLNYRSIISKEAILSPFSKVGVGSIILPGVVVDPEADIKDHVIINKASTIAHDVLLKNFSQVSPGVNFGGDVELGECSFIGLGASVLPNVKINENVVIGAGAVVTKDIDIINSIYVGNPAQLLKETYS
ncbi:acetyltransferase [Halobacillus locisalis]|uniref:Acetyltransferase n=1 Tax=Halobacillus locisalis TaxID=220753 RepID=A0A838CU75_9BACI|nr:acetyltransferase [Halobacillus locisalis]MBA2175359.1 acetyltransferase [Halobacillus locisalis]